MVVGRTAVDASQLYRFKDIQKVASADDLIDIVLSKTQRKTPTEIHPQYDIRRIRSFYMRKVKFCQTAFNEKFTAVLSQFPRLDDIHPFYADLCNVLYDKDHFKLALGSVSSARNTVDGLGKEYVKLLKYADSPYKCKMLKRAGMGRMCTVVRKLKASLAYLEQVRQHLSRLPGINPFNRTLILAGFPNVGKSTFMNALSRANVETASWAFTTKSLYVGHFDYKYQPWQVIDTPGILDRPLASRNTIELTAITAMAHLPTAVLFLVDISGACGYSIAEQVALFQSLRPLLQSKPVVVVLNKIDLRPVADLNPEEQEAIRSMAKEFTNIHFIGASTLLQENLDDAKNRACDMLLATNVEKRLLAGRSAVPMGDDGLPYIAQVQPHPARPAYVPATYLAKVKEDKKEDKTEDKKEALGGLESMGGMQDVEDGKAMLEKEREEREGGPGVYDFDERKEWSLENDEWRYDRVPEMFNGKNIADFIDPDIDEKLRRLEEEEAELEAAFNQSGDAAPTPGWFEAQQIMREITLETRLRRLRSSSKRTSGSVVMPRPSRPENQRPAIRALSNLSVSDKRIKRMAIRHGEKGVLSKIQLSLGDNPRHKHMVEKQMFEVDKRYIKPKKGQNKTQINESDRFIGTAKPKHLFSGKRSNGKTDWR